MKCTDSFKECCGVSCMNIPKANLDTKAQTIDPNEVTMSPEMPSDIYDRSDVWGSLVDSENEAQKWKMNVAKTVSEVGCRSFHVVPQHFQTPSTQEIMCTQEGVEGRYLFCDESSATM